MGEKVDQLWEENEESIINAVKVCLLKKYSEPILVKFQSKIDYLVNKYVRNLPSHVSGSEEDDLKVISVLEFFETVKSWDPKRNADVWPLAYSRINGAMRDHIRYVTKSDPSRFYEWVNDAAHMYLVVNQQENFTKEIDNGDQLRRAMESLTPREKKIVFGYTTEDKTFSEIATELDISESQVSRIYKKCLAVIKQNIEE